MLDSQHGSYYQNASNVNAGTLGTGFYSAYSDLGAEGYLGNAAGDVAQNNNTLQSTLNADLLDGQHGSYYAPTTYLTRSCYNYGNGFTTSSGSWVTVTSCDINLPVASYVFVEANAASGYWDATYEGDIAIGFDSTSGEYWTERWFTFDTADQYMPVSSARIYSLSAGSHTIFFLAKRMSGSGLVWLPRYTLSVISSPY